MITAFLRKLFTPNALQAEIARATANGKPGITALRGALRELGVGRYTPSQLERRAKRLFRALGLPDPQAEDTGAEIIEAYTARTALALG